MYHAESEQNTNITKVLTLQETLTVGADSMREYSFDLSALKNKNVLTSIPVIYDNGKGITIGRVQADNATIRLWNSTGSSKNVGVMNIVLYQ